MTRCTRCNSPMEHDSFLYYGGMCPRCEDEELRRVCGLDVRSGVAGRILFCLIAAIIFVAFMYCMWRSVGGGR